MFDKEVVRAAARGHWHEIFRALAPGLRDALRRPGMHVACPIHGGTNGFRLFKDFAERGNGICNTCGAKTDGFEMLRWVNGWSFNQTVDSVARFLGVQSTPKAFESVKGEFAQGKLLFAGLCTYKGKTKVFGVRIKSAEGPVVRLWGRDLARALKQAEVSVRDNVRIDLIGYTTLEGGRRFNMYSARKLESDEERVKRLAREKLEDERRSARMQALWRLSKPAVGSPVETYLTSRGIRPEIVAKLTDVRWCPPNPVDGHNLDIMLSAVRAPDGRIVNLHRTYLTPDGKKAPVETPKRLMKMPLTDTIMGACIRMGEPAGGGIAVAEGIETALSVTTATGIACWSAISAQGLEHLILPESVKVVLIFADKDASNTGQTAARKLAVRLNETAKAVGLVLEPADAIPAEAKGIDWNDVLRTKGADGFPVTKPV